MSGSQSDFDRGAAKESKKLQMKRRAAKAEPESNEIRRGCVTVLPASEVFWVDWEAGAVSEIEKVV